MTSISSHSEISANNDVTMIGRGEEPRNPVNPVARVALVNPPDRVSEFAFRVSVPLGLGYVAAVARLNGIHADVFDLALDYGISRDDLGRVGLLDGDYDVFGFTTYTESFIETIRIVDFVKECHPHAKIVLGGYHATLLTKEVLRDFPQIDALVLHEGEWAFTRLVKAWGSGGDTHSIPNVARHGSSGAPVISMGEPPRVDQDTLPYPVTQPRYQSRPYGGYVDHRSRRVRRTICIVSSRGCPKRCSFCAIVVLAPRWRARSSQSLLREISYRYDQAAFDHIMFQDANFLVRPSRSVEFARALHAFNPDLTWSGTATADEIVRDHDALEELAALNCAYLEVGIEAGNDGSLGRFNKRTTVAVNSEALSILSASRIPIGLDFIMFEPFMTFEELEVNFRFLLEHDLAGYWPTNCLFSSLKPYPGTAARLQYIAEFPEHDLPSHATEATRYRDPRVGCAYAIASEYDRMYQSEIDRLIPELEDLAEAHLYGEATMDPATTQLVQTAYVTVVRLRHLPYRFFDAMLDEVRSASSKSLHSEVSHWLTKANLSHQLEVVQTAKVHLRALKSTVAPQ